MKSLIVYHSMYKGNTEKIAKIMAAKINADLVHLKECSELIIRDYDSIGFRSGVYKETMSTKLFDFVEKPYIKKSLPPAILY